MPLLLLLLLELFTPAEMPLEAVVYLEYRPALRVEIFPERSDAAAADSGVFRLRLQELGEGTEDSEAAEQSETAEVSAEAPAPADSDSRDPAAEAGGETSAEAGFPAGEGDAPADSANAPVANAFGGDLLSGTTELLAERSRRRGAVYTLFNREDHPLILDLRQAAAQIPHDFLNRVADGNGESFEISTGQFAAVVEFLPDSTMIAVPAQGMMLIVPHQEE